jgi:Ca2+-binding EF-hand superfamily protein
LNPPTREIHTTGDGTITAEGFINVMESLGQFQTEYELLQDLVNEIDVNGSGTIDFYEFLDMMAERMRGPDAEQEMREVFKMLDKERNGYIGAAELGHIVRNLGEF